MPYPSPLWPRDETWSGKGFQPFPHVTCSFVEAVSKKSWRELNRTNQPLIISALQAELSRSTHNSLLYQSLQPFLQCFDITYTFRRRCCERVKEPPGLFPTGLGTPLAVSSLLTCKNALLCIFIKFSWFRWRCLESSQWEVINQDRVLFFSSLLGLDWRCY